MRLMSLLRITAGGAGSGCTGPNCGRPRTNFEEGDRAMLNKVTRAFDEKRLMYRKFPMGTEVTVQSVTKAHAGNPETVTVSSKRLSGLTLPAHELTFLKSGKGKNIDVQPVPKRYVKLEMTLRNGAKYTIIKPEKEGKKRGAQDPSNKKSRFKGEFDKPTKFYGASDRPGQNLKSWVTEATRDERGTTLFIHRYSDSQGRPTGVVIQEHPWMNEHYRMGTPLQFEFRNAGKAMGLLQSRYGISFKMKEWRG